MSDTCRTCIEVYIIVLICVKAVDGIVKFFLTQKTATAQLQVFLFRFEQNDTWSVISFFSYNSTVVLFMGFLYIFI